MSKVDSGNNELAAAVREVAKAIAMFAEVMADRPRPELYAAADKAAEAVVAVLKPSANEVSLRTEPVVQAELTYAADVKPLAQRVLAEKGRPALVQILGECNVEKATELRPETFAYFIEKAQAVLA